jgi:hypothetical protein
MDALETCTDFCTMTNPALSDLDAFMAVATARNLQAAGPALIFESEGGHALVRHLEKILRDPVSEIGIVRALTRPQKG